MKQIPLGKTGLNVSALVLGCMYFGNRTDAGASIQILDRYYEAGGRFLDTSNNYAFWFTGTAGSENEEFLGRWLKARGNRNAIFLATKVGAKPLRDGSGSSESEGLSAAVIERAIDDSLRRLQTDHIDLYYAHIDHRVTPLEERLGAFDRAVKAGKVRQIGCSNFTAWRIAEARLAALAQVAAETGATPNQVVLAWLLQSSPAALPLFGASTVAQLEESLGALAVSLTPEQMATLDNAGA